ncbi:Holliday junction branch migration protein RuvA [Pelotomaculum propionicicum]|uniref:Holliday junction branch migration complex subunit RuvA n=1 Tax=Pelotomaculum propionicicum TaxID=258475 RepID=A0A4Y7RIH5_9FIRM|nr:Holliday junction branch migration protein RuvA [Pelotomaculum propionicicum]TEB08808.1 Holliday junction ATP-dependent DNA helicase RuvA [Pelotomaculum propionicicum]
MIAYIKGRLAAAQAGFVVLEAGGLGYKVQVPLSLQYKLPAPGSELMLHTHFVVREDGFYLYGFQNISELDFFIKLLNVAGVGPKGALAILSIFNPADLSRVIAGEDLVSLTKVPGIGKKTAGRIILELKDKVSDIAGIPEAGGFSAGREMDAAGALEALGYSAAEARRTVREALAGANENQTVEELVRSALRLLMKK